MISLIHPSRGRPEKALETYNNWMKKSSCYKSQSGEGYEHILCLDFDDPQWRKYPYARCIGNHTSVVHATNAGAALAKGDILVYMSDDFDCPDDWDYLLINEFRAFGNNPALVKVDDCLQQFHVPVLTIPIVNRAFYERVGYFWYPEYKSMFCDEDLYWTARKLESLRMAPHLKFPHNHVSVGKAPDDETYRRSAANWDQGKAVFARRKAAGFPV